MFFCGIIAANKGDINIIKAINDINKLIIKKVLEIIFVVVFVFFSISWIKSADMQSMLATASTYANLNYTNLSVLNPIDYSMYPMSDSYAVSNLEPCTVRVMNETLTSENYTLALKISKKSSLNYDYLKIAIDNYIYTLKDLEMKEENDNYFFILDTNLITGDIKDYNIKLWLCEETGNEMQGKELIMSFEIINEVTFM